MKIDGAQGAGLARDRPRAGAAPARAAALPRRPRAARRGRRGGALRRRGAAAPDPPDPLVGDAQGQGAAAQLLGGREAGHPDRAGGEDGGADRRRSRRASTRRPTRTCGATSPHCRRCCRRVDDWIAAGTIDGEQLNAADFQIAPSLRLAMTLDDLRPAIESRPAGELAKRVVPDYPGKTPPILPARLAAAAAQRRPPPPRASRPARRAGRGLARRGRRQGACRRGASDPGRARAAGRGRSGGW